MKILKWLIPLGMLGVVSFLVMDVLGTTLWKGYDPVAGYISLLIANESPVVHLTRPLLNAYNICFSFYALAMTVLAFRTYKVCLRIGYAILFVIAILSLFGYGAVPISIELIFSANNILHLMVTIAIIGLTIVALLMLAIGYLKQEQLGIPGHVSLAATILFTAFNGWHILSILTNQHILGLVERLTFYTFHAQTFALSWMYVYRKKYTYRP